MEIEENRTGVSLASSRPNERPWFLAAGAVEPELDSPDFHPCDVECGALADGEAICRLGECARDPGYADTRRGQIEESKK